MPYLSSKSAALKLDTYLATNDLPAARHNIRACRAQYLARVKGLDAQLDRRLERDPILRDPSRRNTAQFSDHELALALLSDGGDWGQRRAAHLQRLRKPQDSLALHLVYRMAIADIITEPKERRAAYRALHDNWMRFETPATLPRVDAINFVGAPVLRTLEMALCDGLFGRTVGNSTLIPPLIERLRFHAERLRRPAICYRTEEAARKSTLVLPNFEGFFTRFSAPDFDWTSYIESKQVLQLAPELDPKDSFGGSRQAPAIGELEKLGYDYTRVRKFELDGPDGSKLAVVSKRLNPFKSIYAETEFQISKYVFDRGLLTPEPIALIEHFGNTYALWRYVQTADPAEITATMQEDLEAQARSILPDLHRIGIDHLDLKQKSRNGLVSMLDGKAKLWIIDFERAKIVAGSEAAKALGDPHAV